MNPLDDLIATLTDEPTPETEFDTYLDMLTDPSELPPMPFRERLDHAHARLDNWIIPGQFNSLLDDRLKGIFDLVWPRLKTEDGRVHLIDLLNQISRMRP